jgi:hypothetical protein
MWQTMGGAAAWSARGLWLLALGASVGCGGSDGPSEPVAVAQIGGAWNFSETFSESRLGLMCTNRATVTIAQSGATFSASAAQTGTCSDASGTYDNSGTFQLIEGKIDQTSVSWRDDGSPICRYSGNMSGTPPSRMAGSVRCAGVVNGISLESRGSWEMTR